jgi:prolyl oligopeptidase
VNPEPPAAPRSRDVETVAGLSVPDPFRPLEDGLDPAVRAWQRSQADCADAYTGGVPGFDGLRARVARYMVERVGAVPRFAGGRWFRTDRTPEGGRGSGPGRNHRRGSARVVAADEPYWP